MNPEAKKVVHLRGANGESLVVFPCLQHGKHVAIGVVGPGHIAEVLHLEVGEAQELVEALNAGAQWTGLEETAERYRQGSRLARCGIWVISITALGYYFGWKSVGPVVLIALSDVGRGQLAAGVLEVAYGKAAAA